MEYILAIDLGTSGCKAALVDLHGKVHSWAFREVETLLLPGGGAEQDPQAWWQAIEESCVALVAQSALDPASIVALCANTQSECTLPVDEQGEPLANAVLWMDTRGASHVRKQMGGLVKVAGFAPQKLIRMIRLTGGAPSLTGKDPVGHMLFIKKQRPELYLRTHKFLNTLDYVNFKLTGQMVSTVDSLMTSWVTDNRDPGNIKIDKGLCGLIGIAPEKIPRPVPCMEILGRVDSRFAHAVGISPSTPVVAGAIDVTAAAVGSGAVKDRQVHLYLGTSSWLGAHVPFKKTDIVSSIASLPCAMPDKYLMIALQATACGNLNFFLDKVLYGPEMKPGNARPEFAHRQLDQWAERSPAGANGLIYTPWIYGERAPVEDQHIRAGLHNLSLDHSLADIARAMLEGIAQNTRWVLAPVEKFLGRRCRSISVVGGGGNSDIWCRILADVLDRPIRQVQNPIEANVRGSAFIAGMALGKLSYNDIAERTAVKADYEPDPKTRKVYDLHFRQFVKLYGAQKGIHRSLNAFRHRRKG